MCSELNLQIFTNILQLFSDNHLIMKARAVTQPTLFQTGYDAFYATKYDTYALAGTFPHHGLPTDPQPPMRMPKTCSIDR